MSNPAKSFAAPEHACSMPMSAITPKTHTINGGLNADIGGRTGRNIPVLRALNRCPNRAFAGPLNRAFATWKKREKCLFLQQVADGDFALGAMPLSWQN
jgi:hypothetical protein